MPEPYVYEYAVLRLVPVLPREEFINVGIVLFSKNANYIRARFKLDEKRLASRLSAYHLCLDRDYG